MIKIANLIKNNSTQGVYLLIDESNHLLTNNKPGDIDIADIGGTMILGQTYIYFDSVMRLEHRLSFVSEGGDNWVNHNLSAYPAGRVEHWTGECDKGNLILMAECDDETAFYAKNFCKKNNRAGNDGEALSTHRYLIHQYASETFEKFPNHLAALTYANGKQYLPIIVSGCDVIEMEGIKDRKQVIIGMWESWTPK